MVATNSELMNSLPSKVVWYGDEYYLNWSISQYDRRCIQICYRNAYDAVLEVNSDFFYVECERHMATFRMLQLISYYAEEVLGYIYYQNQHAYYNVLKSLNTNTYALQNYCMENHDRLSAVGQRGYSSVIV